MSEDNKIAERTPTVEDNNQGTEDTGQIVSVSAQYSGPLPHPAILKGYDSIVPGAAERIIRMAERNQDHQIDMEVRAIEAQKREVLLGQVFGLVVSLSAFGASIYAMVLGYPAVATILGGSTVVGLTYAFVTGRKPAK